MRIEIPITDTETRYFCDICGEEQHNERGAFGSYCDASDQLETCDICRKEVCLHCRGKVPSFTMNYDKLCKECLETNKQLLTELKEVISQGRQKERELREQLFSHRIKQ
jgi:hypothetical protein